MAYIYIHKYLETYMWGGKMAHLIIRGPTQSNKNKKKGFSLSPSRALSRG